MLRKKSKGDFLKAANPRSPEQKNDGYIFEVILIIRKNCITAREIFSKSFNFY